MLWSALANMFRLYALFSLLLPVSPVFAQTYALQDDYSITNFFNMFNFYNVSLHPLTGPLAANLTNSRVMIPRMATFNT